MESEAKRNARASQASRRVFFTALTAACGFAFWLQGQSRPPHFAGIDAAHAEELRNASTFKPTESQWDALTVKEVEARPFRTEVVTDGKIAIDEDYATPVFSQYAGQVRRLAAQPGEVVHARQLLFTIEATDMIQAQNDFLIAVAGLATAQSQVKLATINEQRQHDLYKATAGPLREWQQAEAELVAAQNNLKSAETALEAVRNRLRILRKTDEEIDEFQKTGKINPETPIYSPIDGTVVQRKVGPGQYITSGASDPTGDPVFIIGDLSTVWLIASVPEASALAIAPGQKVEFKVLADTGRVFNGTLNFTSAVIDAGTRRLTARAVIQNPDRQLKPEMFARVTIITGDEQRSPAVPQTAIVYEGDKAHVWVVGKDKTLEYREITTGLSSGGLVQIRAGLEPGQKVVTKGTLFIDRAASG